MVEAVHVSEPEQGTLPRLERRESAVELATADRVGFRVTAFRSWGRRRVFDPARLAASRLSPPVGGEVSTDPVEVSLPIGPRLGDPRATKAKERLLGEVVRESTIT